MRSGARSSHVISSRAESYTVSLKWVHNLGNSHRHRFERLGELADLDRAMECQSQAVLLCPDGYAHKANRLNSLGNSHSRRFEHLGEPADIDKAIECYSHAAALTLAAHTQAYDAL